MAAPSTSKAIGRMAVVKGDASMTTISIRRWTRARQPRLGQELPQNPVGARAECRRPTRLLSVVVGGAVIFGSLAMSAARDIASSAEGPCAVAVPEGQPCPRRLLSPQEAQR